MITFDACPSKMEVTGDFYKFKENLRHRLQYCDKIFI